MIVDVAKFLKGYVRIKVWGKFPERVINLCGVKGIYIWDIVPESDGYSMCMSKQGYLMLRPILKKSNCRSKIIKKKGFATSKKKVVRGKFFLYSGLISVVLVFFLSQFLWRIEVDGNHYYTDEEVLRALESNGVAVGTYKNKYRVSEIETMLYDDFEEIVWVSCERSGTHLKIGVKEELKAEEVVENTDPCDLIADKDGVIVSIVTHGGTPQVEKGAEVVKGDLLVSGILETYEYTRLIYVDFVHSSADIYVTYPIDYYDEVDFSYIEKNYLEELFCKQKSLIVKDKKYSVPVLKKSDYEYDVIEETKQVEVIKDFYLPVYIMTNSVQPYIEVEKKYTKDETVKLLEEHLKKEVEELKKKDIQISRINVVYNHTDNKTIAKGSLNIVEKIGVEKFFNEEIRRQEYDEYFAEEDGNTP